MYVNESIESNHYECVHFQGLNSVALFTFRKNTAPAAHIVSTGTDIVSTVILTNYERTHKATS